MKIDSDGLNKLAKEVDKFTQELQDVKNQMLDEDCDIFERFLGCRSLESYLSSARFFREIFINAAATGNDISHEIFATPKRKECGWETLLGNPSPFFVDESKNLMNDFNEFMQGILGVSDGSSQPKESEHNKKVAEKILSDLEASN